MYLEEFKVGQKFHLEPITVTKEEIFEFAENYDPQPIHTDVDFANESIFEGIIASGYHTLCVVWKQWIKLNMYGKEIIGGMGLDYLKWTSPVRPNDSLKTEIEVIETTKSNKEGRGILVLKFVVCNQTDQAVLTTQVRAMIKSKG